MMTCCVDLLVEIVNTMNPRCGGKARDLQDYVGSLNISDGESVLDFYM